MRSMNISAIAQILKSHSLSSRGFIQGYSTDSRTIRPGELFFALKGDRVDGHHYLSEVRRRGAIGAVVSKDYTLPFEGMPLIAVDDPLMALQELVQEVLKQKRQRIIGVTGSIGKTSSKDFIYALLSTRYRVAVSPGNSNSQVGLPLSILNHTSGEEDLLVLEMGMTHPGQIRRLIEIAPPEVALINTVALVHATNFEALEDIARAKAEIFLSPQTKLGILHQDIPNYLELCKMGSCQKISFSTVSKEAEYYLDCSKGEELHVKSENRTVALSSLTLPGKHNWHNLLGAIAVARYFDVDWNVINDVIPSLKLPERRLQFIQREGVLFLNDSYNASEHSVKAALETLPNAAEAGRKIAVLGSMLELGKFSDACHQRVGEYALQHVDLMFCLGDECQPIYDVWMHAGRPVRLFHQRADLVASLKKELRPYDVVLLKGSRSKEMWKVLDELDL
jgi:UDP-N-acetylmuramoyl-tripeptide--D-alanyl-D-alanine ligase